MPDIDQNLAVWKDWGWSQEGDEWSAWWGGTPALWYGAILPRIHAWVPTETILEIAPGYGRWTQFLKDLGQRLIVVDLSPQCIQHCRERFSDSDNLEYHVNDGRSLEMVDDRSVDVAFSFDSLVHAEPDVLAEYLRQLARKLKPNGIGFIHHSNLGEYRVLNALSRRVPNRLRVPLVRWGTLIDVYAWRSEEMTASKFAAFCDQASMETVSQELITWEHGPYLIDALSVFTPEPSRGPRGTVIKNRNFNREARRMAALYANPSGASLEQPPAS
jgi:SAM-dependent methyltransferase